MFVRFNLKRYLLKVYNFKFIDIVKQQMHKSHVQQITHGIPYKPRHKQPSMFEILSWNDGQQRNVDLNGKQNDYQIQQNLYQKNKQNYTLNRIKSDQKVTKLDFNKSPHKIKHQLYLYNDQEQKKLDQNANKSNDTNKNLNNQQNAKVKFSKKQQHTLNPNNISDRVQIQKRKKKIKQFKLFSRELPDSAFTTYFGKPAFSNYGSGSRSIQKKTFNIMPHAGQNHPQYIQSYQTALSRGKQIKQNHVPKKPLDTYYPRQENISESDYYSIPIHKPNLINTMRFSQDKKILQRKGRTPKHNQINRIPIRQYNQKPIQTISSNKKKLKKVTSLKNFQTMKNQHPLVISRDNLRQILAEKKKQQNRLAYKVTQCYPLPYNNCDPKCETKFSRWSQMRPAGIVSPRSDHVQDVFYSSNVWS